MSFLMEIQRKLHSVKNIRKITQAMEMVAASRLRKAQEKAEKSRPYIKELSQMLGALASLKENLSYPLIAPREVKKVCYLIIGSDKGLCGGYNQGVIQQAEKLIKESSKVNTSLILIGKKVIDYFSLKKWIPLQTFLNWGEKVSLTEIRHLSDFLIKGYLNRDYDQVWLIYTHYIHLGRQEIRVEKLLNIDKASLNFTPESANYLFEPSATHLMTAILPHYCLTKIQAALYDSYASELASRIFSMRAAVKNSDEMIENLTLTRNKLRQSSITSELIEISAGVESLN